MKILSTILVLLSIINTSLADIISAPFVQTGQRLVTSMAISSDGEYALSAGFDGTLKLWEVRTEKELKTFRGHTAYVTDVVFTPDDKLALSSSADGTIKVWDILTGKEINSFAGEQNGEVYESLAILPNGKNFLSTSLMWLKLWDFSAGKPTKTFKSKLLFKYVVVTPNGDKALTLGMRGHKTKITLWDIKTGKEIFEFKGNKLDTLDHSLAISPNGKYALYGGISSNKTKRLRLWNLETGKEKKTFNPIFLDSKGKELSNVTIKSLDFTTDGRYILSIDNHREVGELKKGTLRVLDIETGKELNSFRADYPFDTVNSVLDGKSILISTRSRQGTKIKLIKIKP